MNGELAKYHLRRLLSDVEPKDADDLDGFLAALAITIVLALGLYVSGVLFLLLTGAA